MQTNKKTDFNDTELSVLSAIGKAQSGGARLTQRDLAGQAGVSLGMANILLRRLAERGWVKLTKLSSKSVRYALTPEGISELASRTAGYFNRASRSVDLYRERVESFVLAAKRGGAGTIVLYGSSEVEIVLAYVCERHGIVFVKSSDLERAQALARKSGALLLYAEGERVDGPGPGESLAAVLAGLDRAAKGEV
jgi:DNA-binding MarR family transcriptional regulator